MTVAWSSHLPSSSSSFLVISYPHKVASTPPWLCLGPFLPPTSPQIPANISASVPQARQTHPVPNGSHLLPPQRAPNQLPCIPSFFPAPELPTPGLESSPILPSLSPPTFSLGRHRSLHYPPFFPSPLETGLQPPPPPSPKPLPAFLAATSLSDHPSTRGTQVTRRSWPADM